jgi:hypothetical protein
VEVITVDLPGGTIASRNSDGSIVVTGTQGAREVDPDNPVGLLPLLELGPEVIPTNIQQALPIARVLTIALAWESSDHWPGLAVDWLAKTGNADELCDALAAFANSDRGSQKTRHAARRLVRGAD